MGNKELVPFSHPYLKFIILFCSPRIVSKIGITLKKSMQWDVVGVSAIVMTFVSFFILMFGIKI